MRFRGQTALLAASLLLLCAYGWADTTSLPLTDDAYIHALKPTLSFGDRDDILVTSYGPKQGLVRFDAATISGQAVTSATLTLYLNDIRNPGTISIHAITSSWSESSVTWNNQPPSESIATAVVTLATSDLGSAISVDVTGAVQRWADGSLADAGFLIATTENIKALFDAKERTGGVPATLSVETDGGSVPPPADGKPIVLDLSDPDNCTIDESGHYVLDRSWFTERVEDNYLPPATRMTCKQLIFHAGATLDMRGFTLFQETEDDGYGFIELQSNGVTIRNGYVEASYIAIDVDGPFGDYVRIENMRFDGAVELGAHAHVRNSHFLRGFFDTTLSVKSNSIVVDSVIGSNNPVPGALSVSGDSVVVGNNTFERPGTLWVSGSNHVLANNTIISDGNSDTVTLDVSGDGNIILSNVVEGIWVNGTANIVEGNISKGGNVAFNQPGNFYGNNRIKGSFSGTAGQTDWGGNVTF